MQLLLVLKALCERKGNDAAVEALRPLFSAAAQRNTDARTRRDALEDKCNQLAAENEAVASELATQRAEAAKALVSMPGESGRMSAREGIEPETKAPYVGRE